MLPSFRRADWATAETGKIGDMCGKEPYLSCVPAASSILAYRPHDTVTIPFCDLQISSKGFSLFASSAIFLFP
jgi:hypothetical protein